MTITKAAPRNHLAATKPDLPTGHAKILSISVNVHANHIAADVTGHAGAFNSVSMWCASFKDVQA